MRPLLLLVLTLAAGIHCTSSPPLTEGDMNKLDPALQWLVEHDGETNGPFRYVTSTREDGTKVYAVIIRAENPEALREAELPLGSVFGEIVTARFSLEQIKQAARMDTVRSIRNSEQDLAPQPPGNRSS